MAAQPPSVQSFFQGSSPRPSPASKKSASSTIEPGDGFTAEEIDAVLHPKATASWTPDKDYEEVDIGSLVPGPQCVTFVGRVVNFYNQTSLSKMPRAAKGCVKVIVKDDTGALTVRLWYAKIDYHLRLGHLVSIWASHVSNGESGSLSVSSAPLLVSIFPERDRNCYLMVHENSDEGVQCKTPLGYRDGQQLAGLMTLSNFVDGGCDVANVKILVCVKSIGARKKVTNKKGIANELVNVGVFDDSGEATLTLWGSAAASATPWKPSFTVLLISYPGWKIEGRTYVALTANTLVDVDPCISDTEWLRNFARRLTIREHVNPPFPEGDTTSIPVLFDVDTAVASQVRILYTLADIDQFIRAAPGEIFMGYLSIIILRLNIMTLYRRNMLMCNECCGVPFYTNAIVIKCKQCDKDVPLRINPKVIGSLIDETGCIGPGKLVFSDKAWEQLLGRTAEELVESSANVLEYLEHRLLFLRTTLVFGWSEETGKLAVCQVKM
ncbi:hypothetical protein BJ546DRAFT_1024446 [Cryomyces antarcticus]